MEPTYTGSAEIERDGQTYSAEVSVRYLPARGCIGITFSSNVERYITSMFGAEHAKGSDSIGQTVHSVLRDAESRLEKPPEIGTDYALRKMVFRANVLHVRVSECPSREDTSYLLTAASRKTAERYFQDLNEGRVQLSASDLDQPFEYQPSTGFDEEYISRRACFLEYAEEKRPGFLSGSAATGATSIEELRAQRILTSWGVSAFSDAVKGYLLGCRPEADAYVAKAYELLSLADSTNEKLLDDESGPYWLARRYAALAYVHWLRTGEPDDAAIAKARKYLLSYVRHDKIFDRTSANLAAPELLFLRADAVVLAIAKRLADRPGRGATPPGGLIGDAIQIASASNEAERESLRAKIKKRMPTKLFRWMDQGHYSDIAYMLHAVFPRPEGPPSRLIERAWDVMPEIARVPGGLYGWDLARNKP